MVEEPIRYVKSFAEAGADGITVHVEACADLNKTIDEIISLGKKAAVSIKPETDLTDVLPLLPKLYMVLIMTVEPGYGGQKIRRDTFDKIRQLRDYIEEKRYVVDIEVDGGVNFETLVEVLDAGANVAVAGTKVFRGDITENVKRFKGILGEYEEK